MEKTVCGVRLKQAMEKHQPVRLEGLYGVGKAELARRVAPKKEILQTPRVTETDAQAQDKLLRLEIGAFPINSILIEICNQPKLEALIDGAAVYTDSCRKSTGEKTLRLRPLSLYEQGKTSGGVSVSALRGGRFHPAKIERFGLDELLDALLRGGLPATAEIERESCPHALRKHIGEVLDFGRDRAVATGEAPCDTTKVLRLLRALAEAGDGASLRELREVIRAHWGAGGDLATLSRYLRYAEDLFLLEPVRAFPEGAWPVRLKRAERPAFCDPALEVALRDWDAAWLGAHLSEVERLFEGLVLRDLRSLTGLEFVQYADYKNRTARLGICLDDKRWAAVACCLGENRVEEKAGELLAFAEALRADGMWAPDQLIVVTALGSEAYQRRDGVFVLPVASLEP